jgi:transcriptional regulator with XRE-family HTH domain
MAKKFADLRAKMPVEHQRRATERTRTMLIEMPLAELREARKLTQETLAQTLRVEQASVSKLERRTDMYLSTLRRYVEAMGGTLEITVNFPDGLVRINQFEHLSVEGPRRRTPTVKAG